MQYSRDPLSVVFDVPARKLITRAYASFGEWAGDYVPLPGPGARAWLDGHGINPYERDRWGEIRWIRSYKRAVFWNVKWYGGTSGLRGERNAASGGGGSWWGAPVRVQWETGIRAERPEWGGQRWAVRMRLHRPGGATAAAGRAARDPWIGADGRPTFRQSLPDDRDWE